MKVVKKKIKGCFDCPHCIYHRMINGLHAGRFWKCEATGHIIFSVDQEFINTAAPEDFFKLMNNELKELWLHFDLEIPEECPLEESN